jgi:curved DNA-binding protein CbpA
MFETSFTESATHYETLDIPPSATPADVREAYLRAKSAYNKDSVALYSLIDSGEREGMLRRIEEAYDVLSNELRRREYDAHHGIIEHTGTIESTGRDHDIAKIVSIDRVPPMESMSSEEDPLIAPATDIPPEVTPNPSPASIARPPSHSHAEVTPTRRKSDATADIEREIVGEIDWSGPFIRRVRDAHGVSIEEMSNVTKISKTYINAIESEEFKKLPAFVFVRGFLVQICRILKLPQEKVLDAYLRRFKAAKIDD